jgi:uncharacterized membrane protein
MIHYYYHFKAIATAVVALLLGILLVLFKVSVFTMTAPRV